MHARSYVRKCERSKFEIRTFARPIAIDRIASTGDADRSIGVCFRRARASISGAMRFTARAFLARARAFADDIERAAYDEAFARALARELASEERARALANDARARALAIAEGEGVKDIVDARARARGEIASRVCASYEILSPALGEERARATIKSHMGAERTARTFNASLVRMALAMSVDKVGTLRGMCENVTNDLAPGEWTRSDDAESGDAEFTTTTCGYHAMFRRRGCEFLTSSTCCSLDVGVWFGDVAPSAGRVELVESMARGDARCRIKVSKGASA